MIKMKVTQFIFAAVVLQVAVSHPASYYKQLTPEQASRLAPWTPTSKQNMWQRSGQYQGDMVLTPGQRNGVTDTRLRWPNNEVPYEFSSDFTASEEQFIAQSLATEYAKTCVTIRPRRAGDNDYVYITGRDTGCWSYVGRLGGRQELNLQRNGCIWYGTIAHEFMHAAGFYHQQSATERDDYVTILWQNIQEGYAYAFDKYGPNDITSFGEKYDYDSVMHYDRYAFSFNGEPTILPKDPNANIGQTAGLSTTDIVKINKMYNCV